MRRRTLLGIGVSAVAISCGRGTGAPAWRCLTAREARVMEAICAQLIPGDRDPGAKEAGVVNYIDIQLCRAFRKHRRAYRQGLADIDTLARTQFGRAFAELDAAIQIEVLKETEKKSPAFFDLLLNHTRQGFYGDPRHGGNRNMASWKMLGLAFPQVRGRQHYPERNG